MDNITANRAQLLLSVQRALLGAVPPSLRQVSCGFEGTGIKLRFVFDGEISEDDRECAQIASTEIIADFSAEWDIHEAITRLDNPIPLSNDKETLAWLAYLRRE